MGIKVTDKRRILGRDARETNPQDGRLRTAYEIGATALEHAEMLEVYEKRIGGASAKLLEKYGEDTKLGPAIRRVDAALKTFLPVEKVDLQPVAWGEVQLPMKAMLSRHTDLVGGAFKGGIRMTPEVNVTTLKTLSSDMTRKLALHGLPMNGGKACVIGDSRKIQGELRVQEFTQFTQCMFPFLGPLAYVPAGDIGTDTPDMEIIRDAYADGLRVLATGALSKQNASVGPHGFDPKQAKAYFSSNVIGVEPADDFLERIRDDVGYAREIANPVVTAKPQDKGGHEIRRGATSRGARVALEEAVIYKALRGEWKSSQAPNHIDESVRSFFRDDGSLSDGGQEVLTKFKVDACTNDEKVLVAGIVYSLCKGKSAVIQGYGKVGRPLHAEFDRLGFKVTAVSDITGIIHNDVGFSPQELGAHVLTTGGVADFPADDKQFKGADLNEVLEVECDVLAPAATGGVIHVNNAGDIKTGIVLEAANDPTTAEGDDILDERGVMRVPDIMANSGGVWASYFEWALNLSENIEGYGDYIAPIMDIHRRIHPEQAEAGIKDLTQDELVRIHEQGMRDIFRSVEDMTEEFHVPMRQASCMRTILNLAEKVSEQEP